MAKKGISYEGPPPRVTYIRSGVTYNEFMERVYQIIGYERHDTDLAVTCKHPIPKE